ncbi:MAG: tryptophan 2,3-dioxygenase [Burkholderiaceae bacterium]|jgi:tryptophan 2,3-dioxygenase
MSTPIDIVAREGAKLDYTNDMTYGDYLHLDSLLSSQQPLSNLHDEMLFIVQHQTSELWMKLMLHELQAAMTALVEGNSALAFKMMARVSRIMAQLVSAWDVLATMTPPEYSALRPHLANSSGFQSAQYRCIEFTLGNKNAAMLKPHAHRPELLATVQKAFDSPSLYDIAIARLAAAGLPIDAVHLKRDWRVSHTSSANVQSAWKVVYQAPDRYWDLYQLGEKLTDIEDTFRQWRFRHLTTVERVIGMRRGTGGTSGTGYLRAMLDVVLFPEIWQMRSEL